MRVRTAFGRQSPFLARAIPGATLERSTARNQQLVYS